MSSLVGVKLVVMLGSTSTSIKPSSSLLSLSVMDFGMFFKNLLNSSILAGKVSCSMTFYFYFFSALSE